MRELKIAAEAHEAAKTSETPSAPMKMDDGRVIHFEYPDATTLMLLLNAAEDNRMNEDGTPVDITASLHLGQVFMRALGNMLSDDDLSYMNARLMNRRDPLTIEIMMENLHDLLEEEWMGRPTEPDSDSSGSPPQTGPSSTGNSKRKGSTRSRSEQTGS